jgi:hypothetical protein
LGGDLAPGPAPGDPGSSRRGVVVMRGAHGNSRRVSGMASTGAFARKCRHGRSVSSRAVGVTSSERVSAGSALRQTGAGRGPDRRGMRGRPSLLAGGRLRLVRGGRVGGPGDENPSR